MRKLSTLLILALAQIGCCSEPFTLSSKQSDITTTLECNEGLLTINLRDKGENNEEVAIIANSPITYMIDGEEAKWELLDSQKSYSDKTLPMLYGEFNEVNVAYSDMECAVKLSAGEKVLDGTLTVRLFESAMAYRLALTNVPDFTTLKETSKWIPANLEGQCFATNGEHEPLGPVTIAGAKRSNRTPLIYNSGDYILSFHECDLVNYPQLFIQGTEDGSSLDIHLQTINISGDVNLPWRTVMVGENMVDLHNQKAIYQTMSPEAEGDYSWVKPGLCMWDWRVKGTTFDGFTYEMNNESLKRYIDFCSKSNISYFLIDAEWYEKHDPMTPVSTIDIKEVIAYGKEKGVGLFLYYDLNYVDKDHPKIDFDKIAAYYAELGAVGMKYGFLKAKNSQVKTVMTHEIINTAAKHKLMVDFHDAPIPFSGLERTMPNYVNREYCHAQLDRRAAFNPRQFVKMACINLLAGHMDQTNGTFALNEMATRSKGPRNRYDSTVSAEVARFVFTHTGTFSVMIDAPEAYEQKADLFKVISSLPTSWDETIYLDMDWNSRVAVAKRSGDKWFASVVYGENGGKYELSLDFLDSNAKYTATIYRDADDTDCRTNKEAYTIESREVTSDNEIAITVPAGGGFSVIFEKK